MPGHVDDVVRAAHDPEIAVFIFIARIRGQVVAGISVEVRPLIAFIVVPQRRKTTGRERKPNDDVADLPRRHLPAIGAQHAHVVPRNRLGARSRLHGQHPQADAIGSHRPARFRLPPVIDDRHAELLFGPQQRGRIAPLTGEEEGAERAQIVLADVFTVGVFPFNGPERRRRREERSHTMLGDQTPERARVGRADGFALIQDRGVPIEERAIDDVGVADRPA